MSPAQHHVLSRADADGRLIDTDKRVLGGLVRRGWAREHVVEKRRGKRVKQIITHWITDAGKHARETGTVVTPPPKPHWRTWTHTRLFWRCYLVEHHILHQADKYQEWRLVCLARTNSNTTAASADTLAETVDALYDHLRRSTCRELLQWVGSSDDTTPATADDLHAMILRTEGTYRRC
jgi:hypothetical protein